MKTLSLQNKIELLGLEAMDLVETTDVVSKNAVVKNTQEMLRKVKGAKAEDETTFGNLLMWSGSYLADNYPMTPTAILFYVSAINWADSYFSGSECDLIYQIVRYLLLVISLGYLTLMGYRTSTAMNFSEFVRTFWVNWVVFILMIMTLMALPPVSCYGHVYTAIMNVVGVFGLLAMALTLHAVNGDRSRFVFVLNRNMCSHSDFVVLFSVMMDTLALRLRNRRNRVISICNRNKNAYRVGCQWLGWCS